MKNTKKNNKGFSLVELIVVVLIMAILAVALAPQVMKWVENSRVATDVQNYDSLVANCQLALTDTAGYTAAKNNGPYVITLKSGAALTVTAGGTAITKFDVSGTNAADDGFIKALNALDSSWSKLQLKKTSGTDCVITITTTGVVEKTTQPTSTME